MFTATRHRYLRALAALRQRPRLHTAVGFHLMELGLVDWLYPAPDGGWMVGPDARSTYPQDWPAIRHKAIERPSLLGLDILAKWDAGIKDA